MKSYAASLKFVLYFRRVGERSDAGPVPEEIRHTWWIWIAFKCKWQMVSGENKPTMNWGILDGFYFLCKYVSEETHNESD